MDSSALWNKAKTFVQEYSQYHIFCDSDADGISAGLLCVKGLESLGKIATLTTRASREDILSSDEFLSVDSSYSPEAIIIVDLNPVSFGAYDSFRLVFGEIPLLIIDHHEIHAYADALFIHPQELFGIRGDRYCSAKVVFDLFSSVTSMDAHSWIAAVGIVGDMNERFFPEIVKEFPQAKVLVDYIFCASAVDEESLLDYIAELRLAQSFDEALRIPNPHPEVALAVQEEIVSLRSQLKAGEAVHWHTISSPFSISGWVANSVSVDFPGEVFVILREKGNGFSMSVRAQHSRIHVGRAIKSVASRFGGGGGGHAPAAGGWVPSSSLEEFKKAFEEAIRSPQEFLVGERA